MAVIRRANNEKDSDKRYGGNWRSEAAKALVGLAGVAGLGMIGSRLYSDYNAARSFVTAPYEIYTKAVESAKTAGALEAAKVASQGLNYMPTIPGGFPKL
ncbi:MAG: hypothetical protein RLZZ86_100 [Cyanobacteriota bacterium]